MRTDVSVFRRRLAGACLTAASVVALTGATGTRAEGVMQGDRLLVVAAAPPSYREIAHMYNSAGRLLDTVKAPDGASITWSSDGSMIAIGDSAGLWVERADGSGQRRLLATKTTCRTTCAGGPSVAWTPDDKQLAVGGVDPRTTGFVLVDVATGKVTPLAEAMPYVFHSPIAFSPNGRWLAEAFSSGNAGTASCCKEELIVARADGSKPRVLRRFSDPIHDGPGAATWSPDSTQIAFTDDGRDPHDPRLATINIQSGRLTQLDPHHVYDQSPAWSPDGKSLALAQYQGAAFSVGTDGNGFTSLAVEGNAALWLRNGDILIATGTTGRRIDLISPGHGTPRTLTTLPNHEQLLSFRESRLPAAA